MASVVLLIFIGFLGPTCVNLNNEFQSASSTVSPHNTSLLDKTDTVKTQMINRVVQLWPAANRTEIKTFRKGPLIISRRYWYPSLVIGLKKPQPTSSAFTTATTPTVPNTTQSFTSNLPPSTLQTIRETTTSEPPTSNTTKTTISTQPNLIIQTSTTNEKPTSRSISAVPPTNTASSTTNMQQETINPTQPNITTHSILSTDYSIQQTTTATPLVTSMSSTRTTLATTLRVPINNTTKHKTTRNKLTTASQVTAESVGMETSVQKTIAVSSTNLPTTPGTGDGFQEFKTTITPAGTAAKKTRSPTTPLSLSNTLGSTVTPGTTKMATTASPNTDTVKRTTPKVATETVMKTGNSTNPPEEPTTTIGTSKVKTTKKLPNETTVSTSETASSGVFTTADSTTSRSSGMTSTLAAAVSETSTTANVRNVQETTAVKTTPISSASTDIRTMTTGLAKHATVSEGITLVPEITKATTESSQAKTESGTQAKPVTVAHTLGSATTVIGVTQEPATQINSESATVNVRTMTTEQAKLATVHNDLETPEVTTESSKAKSTTIISKAVTIDHTLEGSTNVIRVTLESTKQADPGTASTAHSTLKSNTAQSSNAPTIASESGTRTSTKVIDKPEVITSKITSTQGSSSVINSESATVDIRTKTTGTLPEDFTLVQETTKPVTMAPTLEGPTTVIRVTQLDASTASTTHTTLKSNTAQSSNLTTRETESGTSTSTAVMNESEAIRTKTTPVEYTNSVFKSTTEGTRTTTTGLVKSATVPKASTLVIETSRVTMEPPLDQTATVTSKPVTVAHTLTPNTVIRATQTDLSSASKIHTTLKESNTAKAPGTSSGTTVMNEQETSTTKTLAQGSSSVINSESATVDIRTTTTNTLPEDLTLVAETPEFTTESSPAKTESKTLISVTPVTVAHTLDGSTTVIRVTQEPLTLADSNSAPTAHSTLDESNTAKTNAPGTSTETAVINEQETSTTKMTSAQVSSSIKHYESATVDIKTMTTGQAEVATLPEATLTLVPETSQVTTESSPAKKESTTVKSKQVTVAHTLEGSTTVIRVTQEPGTQAEAGTASTTHTTLNKSNIDDSINATTTLTGSSTTTTFINEPEITATKTTLAQDSNSVINSAIAEARMTTTTGLAKLATVPEALTLVLQTFNVTIEPSPPKTKSTTQDVGADIASTAHSTNKERSSTAKTNAPNTANAQGTAATVINDQVTSITKITSAEGLVSVIKSTAEVTKTTTTGSSKLATESKSSTLVPQTSRVTMEPSPAKTQSAIVTSKPVTEAQTFEEPTRAIRVTQEHGTQDDASTALSAHTIMEKSNTSSNAHNTVNAPGTSTATTAINQPEASTTKTTSPESSSSVIKSTTEVTKTTTTGSSKLATESKSSSLEPQTSRVTMKPSTAKTQSAIITSKPVTEGQTFKEPTSAIRVTQEHGTQDDASTALSAHTTMEPSPAKTQSVIVTSKPVTEAQTFEGPTSAIRVTQDDASTALSAHTTMEPSPAKTQSVIVTSNPVTEAQTFEGPTSAIRVTQDDASTALSAHTTMEPSPAKTQSVIVTSNPVTEAQTFEGPTSAIRVTQDDASTALSAHTTMEKSNTSPTAPNTVNSPGTSNATTPINRPEASTTKTTSTQDSSSVNESSTEVTKTTGLAKNDTESKGSTLVPMEPSPAKTQSTAQVSIMPITVAHNLEGPTTNATTTAPPVALPTVPKFASPTSQTLKSTKNTTTYTIPTTISPKIKSTNASRNASVAHSTPAQPHRHEPTSLKPPTSTAAMSVATELPTHQPVLNEGSIDLLFSLNETFITVYSDRTTADFLSLATKVVIAINKLYRGEYKEFKRSRVNSFSKGSIKVDMTLVFENTSVVPRSDNVENVLFNAVTITGIRLNIINETIKAVPTKTDALTTINQANMATVQQTTVKTNTGYTNTSSASAWILHFSILAATAIITVFVTRAVV